MSRVSVLLPVRNPRLDWLDLAITSVLLQSLREWELLVVVDDATPLSEFLERYGDERIRHLHLPHMPGLPAALNHGLSEAGAPLVARVDADDICEPERLAKQLALFDQDERLDVAGSQLLVIDETGSVIGRRRYPTAHDDIVASLRRYCCIGHPSVMFKRARIIDAGGYAAMRGEDYDLWCRLAAAGARFANHPEALIRYRYHSAYTRADTRQTLRATIDIKRRNFASLGFRGEARLLGEQVLMRLPSPVVNGLFRLLEFRSDR